MPKTKGSKLLVKSKLVFLICFVFVHGGLFAQDYFPMNLGNTWIYNQLDTNGLTIGKDSMVINSNYSVLNLDIYRSIKYYTPPFIFIDSEIVQFFNDTLIANDVYVLEPDSTVSKRFQHQYSDGDFWLVGADSVKVIYLGPVTVPAGNFNDCYYVYSPTGFGAGFESGFVCAPNVGIIKTVWGAWTWEVLKSYAVTLGINSPDITDNVILYPNPALDLLQIYNPSKTTRVEIVDLNGRQVMDVQYNGKTDIQIDIAGLPGGMFFINIDSESRTITKKLVKQ